MIGRLWLLACGQVRVRVTGASLTRFLNLCAAQGITLRQMDRTVWNELHATLSIRDFRTLRRHMGRTGCRVHISENAVCRSLRCVCVRARRSGAELYSPRRCAGCSARMYGRYRPRSHRR
ncbi:hypothetical protein DXB94_02495 [Butyricicoccus sp. OM06-6AC]|nr:hypothetical protein DXB94_02495 [Butyricicoccus sp. OM06-6AC]